MSEFTNIFLLAQTKPIILQPPNSPNLPNTSGNGLGRSDANTQAEIGDWLSFGKEKRLEGFFI
jgi:hypothetical protein